MKHLLFKALAITVLCAVGIDAACKQYSADKNCPQDTPCCKDGWCSNDPSFCSTGCQPENSFSPKSCFPPAYCVNKYDDFTASTLINIQNFSGNPLKNDWTSDFTPDYATVQDGNLVLSMKYDPTKKNIAGNYAGFGSTVSTTRWMEYGRVSARIKTASSKLGVVTSFITRNLDGDEIDFEWVGLNPNEAQSNFYYKGVLDYSNAVHTDIGSDSSADYHTYEIEWMPDYTTWYVDGKAARTLNRESTKAANGTYLYPTGPQRIQFSVWDGGEGLKGTADWAGTPTDWSDQNRVYTMFVDWVNITCLYQGNETTQWPPAGYGPPTPTNSTSSPYQTIGTGTPGTGGDGSPGSAASAAQPTIPPSDSGAIHSVDSSVTFGVFSLLVASLIASMMFTSNNYL